MKCWFLLLLLSLPLHAAQEVTQAELDSLFSKLGIYTPDQIYDVATVMLKIESRKYTSTTDGVAYTMFRYLKSGKHYCIIQRNDELIRLRKDKELKPLYWNFTPFLSNIENFDQGTYNWCVG